MKACIIGILFVSAALALSFWLAGALPSAGEAQRPVLAPPSALASAAPKSIQGVGYTEPVSEARKLTFKREGVINVLCVRYGDHVERGDTLAKLDTSLIDKELLVAEAEVRSGEADMARVVRGVSDEQIRAAEGRLSLCEIKVKYWKKEAERHLELRQRNSNSVTEAEMDRTQMELHCAELESKTRDAELQHLKNYVLPEDREQAEAKVELAKAKVRLLEQHKADACLHAPCDGTVLEIVKQEGEAARLFDPSPVMIIGDTSHVRIRAEVDERYAHLVKEGQVATIRGRTLGSAEYKGRVAYVKQIMGNKTVFSREATERKDLDVLQVFLEPSEQLEAPMGLKVDIEIQVESNPLPEKNHSSSGP